MSDRLRLAECTPRACQICGESDLFGDLYLHHLGDITDAQLWASGEREEAAVRVALAASRPSSPASEEKA